MTAEELLERAAIKVDRLADWQEHKVAVGRPDVVGAPALRHLAVEIRALKSLIDPPSNRRPEP